MKRGFSIFGMFLVAILWIVGMIAATHQSAPTTAQKRIWLPDTFQIANHVDGKFTPVSEVKPSGTLLYLPFEDFKNQFGKVPTTVIVQSDGMVYYMTKKDGLSYAAKRMHGSTAITYFTRVTRLENSLLTIEYTRNWLGYIFGIFVLTVACALIEGMLASEFNKTNKAN